MLNFPHGPMLYFSGTVSSFLLGLLVTTPSPPRRTPSHRCFLLVALTGGQTTH
jgi:hypothetical protein